MAFAMVRGVTIRITSLAEGPARIVRVDGWLTVDDVAALEDAVGDRVRETRLELADLRSADPTGVAALRALEARGAQLHDAAPFLRLLLGTEGPTDPSPQGDRK
jgi:hypothetical protein